MREKYVLVLFLFILVIPFTVAQAYEEGDSYYVTATACVDSEPEEGEEGNDYIQKQYVDSDSYLDNCQQVFICDVSQQPSPYSYFTEVDDYEDEDITFPDIRVDDEQAVSYSEVCSVDEEDTQDYEAEIIIEQNVSSVNRISINEPVQEIIESDDITEAQTILLGEQEPGTTVEVQLEVEPSCRDNTITRRPDLPADRNLTIEFENICDTGETGEDTDEEKDGDEDPEEGDDDIETEPPSPPQQCEDLEGVSCEECNVNARLEIETDLFETNPNDRTISWSLTSDCETSPVSYTLTSIDGQMERSGSPSNQKVSSDIVSGLQQNQEYYLEVSTSIQGEQITANKTFGIPHYLCIQAREDDNREMVNDHCGTYQGDFDRVSCNSNGIVTSKPCDSGLSCTQGSGNATCRDVAVCDECDGPMSTFPLDAISVEVDDDSVCSSLRTQNVCYVDFHNPLSLSAQYKACSDVTSCADYKGQSSCESNTCFRPGLDCEWVDNDEFEAGGVCKPKEDTQLSLQEQADHEVASCGLAKEEYEFKPGLTVNTYADPTLCQNTIQENTGVQCLYTPIGNLRNGLCTSRINTACETYNSVAQNENEDIQDYCGNATTTDFFDLGTCKIKDGVCVKDALGNDHNDCGQGSDEKCHFNHEPPTTSLVGLPQTNEENTILFNQELLTDLDIVVTDHDVIEEFRYTNEGDFRTIFKIVGDEKDEGSLEWENFYDTPDKFLKKEGAIQELRNRYTDNPGQDITVMVSSKDGADNPEQPKEYTFKPIGSVNDLAVESTTTFYEDGGVPVANLTLDVVEPKGRPLNCEINLPDSLDTVGSNPIGLTGSSTEDISFEYGPILEQGYYEFLFTCTDVETGQQASKNVQAYVDNSTIRKPSPSPTNQSPVASGEPVNIRIETLDPASCQVNYEEEWVDFSNTEGQEVHTSTIVSPDLEEGSTEVIEHDVRCTFGDGWVDAPEHNKIRYLVDNKRPNVDLSYTKVSQEGILGEEFNTSADVTFTCDEEPIQRPHGVDGEAITYEQTGCQEAQYCTYTPSPGLDEQCTPDQEIILDANGESTAVTVEATPPPIPGKLEKIKYEFEDGAGNTRTGSKGFSLTWVCDDTPDECADFPAQSTITGLRGNQITEDIISEIGVNATHATLDDNRISTYIESDDLIGEFEMSAAEGRVDFRNRFETHFKNNPLQDEFNVTFWSVVFNDNNEELREEDNEFTIQRLRGLEALNVTSNVEYDESNESQVAERANIEISVENPQQIPLLCTLEATDDSTQTDESEIIVGDLDRLGMYQDIVWTAQNVEEGRHIFEVSCLDLFFEDKDDEEVLSTMDYLLNYTSSTELLQSYNQDEEEYTGLESLLEDINDEDEQDVFELLGIEEQEEGAFQEQRLEGTGIVRILESRETAEEGLIVDLDRTITNPRPSVVNPKTIEPGEDIEVKIDTSEELICQVESPGIIVYNTLQVTGQMLTDSSTNDSADQNNVSNSSSSLTDGFVATNPSLERINLAVYNISKSDLVSEPGETYTTYSIPDGHVGQIVSDKSKSELQILVRSLLVDESRYIHSLIQERKEVLVEQNDSVNVSEDDEVKRLQEDRERIQSVLNGSHEESENFFESPETFFFEQETPWETFTDTNKEGTHTHTLQNVSSIEDLEFKSLNVRCIEDSEDATSWIGSDPHDNIEFLVDARPPEIEIEREFNTEPVATDDDTKQDRNVGETITATCSPRTVQSISQFPCDTTLVCSQVVNKTEGLETGICEDTSEGIQVSLTSQENENLTEIAEITVNDTRGYTDTKQISLRDDQVTPPGSECIVYPYRCADNPRIDIVGLGPENTYSQDTIEDIEFILEYPFIKTNNVTIHAEATPGRPSTIHADEGTVPFSTSLKEDLGAVSRPINITYYAEVDIQGVDRVDRSDTKSILIQRTPSIDALDVDVDVSYADTTTSTATLSVDVVSPFAKDLTCDLDLPTDIRGESTPTTFEDETAENILWERSVTGADGMYNVDVTCSDSEGNENTVTRTALFDSTDRTITRPVPSAMQGSPVLANESIQISIRTDDSYACEFHDGSSWIEFDNTNALRHTHTVTTPGDEDVQLVEHNVRCDGEEGQSHDRIRYLVDGKAPDVTVEETFTEIDNANAYSEVEVSLTCQDEDYPDNEFFRGFSCETLQYCQEDVHTRTDEIVEECTQQNLVTGPITIQANDNNAVAENLVYTARDEGGNTEETREQYRLINVGEGITVNVTTTR